MKPLYLALLLALASTQVGCVTTTTTSKDGTVTTRKEADRDVLRFAGDVVVAYAPRRIERSGK